MTISPAKAGPIQIDGDVLGVPLDDDPFAKVEGVKMLKPTSRPDSPPAADGSRSKSRDDRKASSAEELNSDTEGRPSPFSLSQVNVNGGEPQTVAPPVISGAEGAQDHFSGFLSESRLFMLLLEFLSFYDWCMILSLSREIRFMIVQTPNLREAVLERFLKPVVYARWAWNELEPLSLSLQVSPDYL